MILILIFLISPFTSFANSDLDHYIRHFNYKALEMPPKNKSLYLLGIKLFYDKGLSGKNNISCQSCHSLTGYSGDSLPLGLGEGAEGLGEKRIQKTGMVLRRHTPSIYNAGLPGLSEFFWDGRVSLTRKNTWQTPEPKFNGPNPELASVVKTFTSPLAMQSIFPLTSPEEMLGKESKLTRLEAWDQVMNQIFKGRFAPTYESMFKAAYPGVKAFNIAHVGNALAELIRHHFSATNTLWDLYLRGRKDVLSERMKRGAVLFNTKAKCIFCHNGNQFSNEFFENIGAPQIGADDKGRSLYQFKVPQLRNVGVSAPYMHSGAFKTLREVVSHYDNPIAGLRNFKWNNRHPNYTAPLNLDRDPVNNDNRENSLSPRLALMLDLSHEEMDDLVCFLAVALTDVSLQRDLIKKGIVNEISDCAPRSL